jgi:DNA-binding IclR family transcriptional regulator
MTKSTTVWSADRKGQATIGAAVSVSMPTVRYSPGRVEQIAPALGAAARHISAAL